MPYRTPDFRMRLNDEQKKKLATLARREKMDPLAWLDREATRACRKILGENGDFSFKEAGVELGLSHWSVRRYYKQGVFPNAYMINHQTVRIPRGDVEKLKRDRAVIIK